MLKVQEIREIIKLVDQSSINEFSYEAEGTKVSMKKQSETIAVQAQPTVQAVKEVTTNAPVQQPVQVAAEAAPEQPAKENSVNYDYEITSPMVGSFYSSPNPESGPFVSVGSKVSKDTVVCIVEAMKLFNEIEAEVSGEVVEVLAENGELVEYGQPLFRVKTK